MGKSEGNAIYLIDDEKTIKKKVMKAVTDAGPTEPNSVKPEPIANLFTMMEIVSTKDTSISSMRNITIARSVTEI